MLVVEKSDKICCRLELNRVIIRNGYRLYEVMAK